MMKKRIHVHQNRIRGNLKNGTYEPVLTVRTYKGVTYAHQVHINGPSSLVYPEKPLSCGARVWIETEAPVTVEVEGQNDYVIE